MDTDIDRLLYDYEGAAKALSLSRAALRDLIYKGRGPITTKIGRRTFFARKDLEAFVEDHRVIESTSSVQLAPTGKRKRGRPTMIDLIMREQQTHLLK